MNKIDIICCDDDPVKGVKESVDIISNKYSSITTITKLNGLGHFSSLARGTQEFPEILDVILK